MTTSGSSSSGGDVRRFSRQQIIQHVKKSLLYTAFDVKWVPQTASFAVVGQYPNNHGALSLYQLHHGDVQPTAEVRLPHPLKCCTFGHNVSFSSSGSAAGAAASQMACGDFAGSLQILDLSRLSSTPASASNALSDVAAASVFHIPHAHESIINAIDGARYSGPPEVATGSRDGSVKVWDTRQSNKPVVSLNPADPARARDCWTVRLGNSFVPDERVVAAGYDNGDIKIFDLRTQKMLHEMHVSNGVCDLEFDRPDIPMNKLIVSSLEGRVRCYDMRTLHPKLGYAYVEERVSEGTVWCSRALPQNREIFLSGGGGELTLCLYKYPPERTLKDGDGLQRGVAGAVEELNKAKVGDQPINAMDWNRSKEGLAVCASFDQSIRVILVTKLGLLS
ncbi:putative WD domain, G-beta repeat [Leishmania naiffi]|uniref:WD domain, G-beta repeat n=1 Tax=Leishmania naiffi TaxID=5678 RepID=A0AAW3BYB4_9TRYP